MATKINAERMLLVGARIALDLRPRANGPEYATACPTCFAVLGFHRTAEDARGHAVKLSARDHDCRAARPRYEYVPASLPAFPPTARTEE